MGRLPWRPGRGRRGAFASPAQLRAKLGEPTRLNRGAATLAPTSAVRRSIPPSGRGCAAPD